MSEVVKPRLKIESAATSAKWLEEHLGAGPLSGLFEQNGRIVHTPCVGQDGYIPPKKDRDDNGPAEVTAITEKELHARIQFEYDCYKVVEATEKKEAYEARAVFPQLASQLAFNCPSKMRKLRHLRAVIHVPMMRNDGTMITKPGYDERSELLYLPAPGLHVPKVSSAPSELEMKRAFTLIETMIGEFPFATNNDQCNYLGLLLTPLLREMVPPPYKLHAIGAPSPGSGKSFLAAAVRTIHGGVFRSEFPDSEAELGKSIAGILTCTTAPAVQFDNVTGILKSSKMAGLLTSAQYSDRVLGSTNERKMVNDRVWIVTGNNLVLGGDMVRRTVQITIDPRMPNPETRDQFKVKDFEGWVREHRGQLVWALLTLVSNWVALGKPRVPSGTSDSYKAVTEALNGILDCAGVWGDAGVYDHADSRRVSVGADDEEWGSLLEASHAAFGTKEWTVREFLAKVVEPYSGPMKDDFIEQHEARQKAAGRTISIDALPGELHERVMRNRGELSTISKSLGRWLMNRDGRYVNKMTARRTGKDRVGVALWAVELVEGAEVAKLKSSGV